MIRFRDLTKEQRGKICKVVYLLVSPSGRLYVGQTANLERRLREYRYCHCDHQRRLKYSIGKYGFDDFEIFILEECETDRELDVAETKWISYWNTISREGLNSMSGGGSLKRHSEESRHKMRTAKIGELNSMWGNTHTLEARKKISEAHKGQKRTPLQKELFGNLFRGKTKSIEQRVKMATAKCEYSYYIVSPFGDVYTTNNLSAFCKENELSEWKLGEVARGKRDASRDWNVRRDPL